ncbi:hypothetical protein DFP76_10714 [Marinomonas aquiplantarum]|uniref:Uncharacterized protein n=2 Tax=Marinomonas aquiplantarum TaxID=491951 RepID=A0A366CVK5_9GAMM|nr:hypothetical protein DFP76_10714 [Marinomonas aquiplantarum]
MPREQRLYLPNAPVHAFILMTNHIHTASTPKMRFINKSTILHLDGTAGLTAGILLLLLKDWLSHLYGLPIATIQFLAAANVCYGVYALSLAFSCVRKRFFILLLAMANVLWMLVCVMVIWHYFQTISLIGVVFLGLEGIFVMTLAYCEWKYSNEFTVKSKI